jgi:hypothetical protein
MDGGITSRRSVEVSWTVGSDRGRSLLRLCSVGGPGVEPHGLQTFLHNNHTQTMSDTWRPWIGPRVLIPFATKRHVSLPDSTIANQSTSATSPLYDRTVCTVLPRQTVRTVRTGTVSIKFFLPVWLDEQIAISSPYGVHLTK